MKRRTFLGSVAASTTAAALFERPLEAAQSQPAKATKVTLLGTGTPAPSLQRVGSGYLVEVGNAWGEDLMELTFAGATIANIEG